VPSGHTIHRITHKGIFAEAFCKKYGYTVSCEDIVITCELGEGRVERQNGS
jgi:hypothetical protein